MKLVIDDTISPYCDRPGCRNAWPVVDGKQLPADYRWAGIDYSTGKRIIRLYCSKECADGDCECGSVRS